MLELLPEYRRARASELFDPVYGFPAYVCTLPRKAGCYLDTIDGAGKPIKAPFMSLRIAGATTRRYPMASYRQAMQVLRSVRRAAVNTPEKRFVID